MLVFCFNHLCIPSHALLHLLVPVHGASWHVSVTDHRSADCRAVLGQGGSESALLEGTK